MKPHVQTDEFVNELCAFVEDEIHRRGDMTYCRDVVKIIDARNCYFCCEGCGDTDESEDRYALKDLCRLTDDIRYVPDKLRIRHIALNYWRE